MREVIVKQSIQELAVYVRAVEPKSFTDVIDAKSPSFKMIALQYEADQLQAILGVELTKICQLLAFNISGEMIAECAANIADEFWYCKLDDIKLFKTYLFRNKLPVDLYRNDALVLYRLFEEYELLRHREVVNDSEKRRKRELAASEVILTGKEIPMPDYVKESSARLEKKLAERKLAFDVDLPVKKEEVREKAQIASESMEWAYCEHEFIEKQGYTECHKCGSVINDTK